MGQAVQGRVGCARQPKKWTAKNAKDRCKCGHSKNPSTLRSRLGVRVTEEELNMNRETVGQIVKKNLGMRKISI
jgi:hypothetical protein